MTLYDVESVASYDAASTKIFLGRTKALISLVSVVLLVFAGLSGYSRYTANTPNVLSRQLYSNDRILRQNLEVGCIEEGMSVEVREQLIKAKCDIVGKYQNVWQIDYQWVVKHYLDMGKDVLLIIEFKSDSYVNLDDIMYGAFDPALNRLCDQILADGNRPFWVRFMHEFNGDWYPWGTYRTGNSPEKFKQAYRHVAELFRNRGTNVKLQLSYNCENPNEDPKPMIDWFPGTDVVDMILCSAYNMAGSDIWHMEFESFEQVFQRGYDQMLTLPGNKPLGVAETSSTNWGGDKIQWMKDAFNSLKHKYDRVEQVNWFLVNKWDGNWDLNSVGEQLAFGEAVNGLN